MEMSNSKIHPSLKLAFYAIGLIFIMLFIATAHTIKVALTDNEGSMKSATFERNYDFEKVKNSETALSKEGYKFSGAIFQTYKINSNSIPVEIFFYKEDMPVEKAKLEVKIERGATEKFNSIVQLSESEKGKYTSTINFSGKGQWVLTVKAELNNKTMETTFPVQVEF
jgi:nitrogen fixation protein FixH